MRPRLRDGDEVRVGGGEPRAAERLEARARLRKVLQRAPRHVRRLRPRRHRPHLERAQRQRAAELEHGGGGERPRGHEQRVQLGAAPRELARRRDLHLDARLDALHVRRRQAQVRRALDHLQRRVQPAEVQQEVARHLRVDGAVAVPARAAERVARARDVRRRRAPRVHRLAPRGAALRELRHRVEVQHLEQRRELRPPPGVELLRRRPGARRALRLPRAQPPVPLAQLPLARVVPPHHGCRAAAQSARLAQAQIASSPRRVP